MRARRGALGRRHVELNPVCARLAERAEDWPWSSARTHPVGRGDGLVDDWAAFLAVAPQETELEALRRHERTGRPLGDAGFVTELEQLLGRRLRRGKPGPRGRDQTEEG